MQGALKKARMEKNDIDLLIYCGVGKVVLEPANAYCFANKLGMKCPCFDIADACMSWVRALEIAHEFIKSKNYKTIMIINGEFNSHYGFPNSFKITSMKQLRYTFPAYTIGSAASATIVTESTNEWTFKYKTVPELFDLCMIPVVEYKDYLTLSEREQKSRGNARNNALHLLRRGDVCSRRQTFIPAHG